MNEEIWKTIPGFEGYSEVSSLARVRTLDRSVVTRAGINPSMIRTYKGRILAQMSHKGYLSVRLWRDNKQKMVETHRLVARAFVANPHNKPHVNHKDGNGSNNLPENLEWVTVSENQFHSCRVLKNNILEKNPRAKLNREIVRAVRYCKLGEMATRAIVKWFGISEGNVRHLLRGDTWIGI